MSDIDGFDWWFTGEYGRDQMLRERYESLQADAAATQARTSRLSSQLSRLQGSLEARLDALTAAFDAYVELGDVREQLAPYADEAMVRRDAMAAIAELGAGRPAEDVEDRDTGYWIAPATNAVIARATGHPDLAAEEALAARHPEAEVFIVAAAGALGRGVEVAGRVPTCLQPNEGRLDDRQQALWHAVLLGRYGDTAADRVLSGWSAELSDDPAGWWQWASAEASTAKIDVLDWIDAQPDWIPELPDGRAADGRADLSGRGTADSSAGSSGGIGGGVSGGISADASSLSDLQEIVMEVISAGEGEERALLSRARELRAKIENPVPDRSETDRSWQRQSRAERQRAQQAGHSRAHNGDQNGNQNGDQNGEQADTVLQIVRASYRDAPPGSPGRAAIMAAVAPALTAAVDAEAPKLLSPEPPSTVIRIGGRAVPVTSAGPDHQALAKATASARQDSSGDRRPMYIGAGVAVVAAVVGLIAAVFSVDTGVVVFLLLIAAIGGAVALNSWWRERRDRQQQIAEEARRANQLQQAQEQAAAVEREHRELIQRRADQLDRVRITLGSLADGAYAPRVAQLPDPTSPSLSETPNAGAITRIEPGARRL